MRIEYGFELSQVDVPRFSVEAVEGIGKLFTLATLVLNVLEGKPRVEIVFHGLNPEDPEKKIQAFKEIVDSCDVGPKVRYTLGKGGQIPGSSSSFRWITVEAVEGIGKVFTLATLVLNVLETRPQVELVFHGLNPEDPGKKITGFKEILASSAGGENLHYAEGRGGRVTGSSSSYQWLIVTKD